MNINEIVDPTDCAGTVFAKAILIYFIGTFFLIMAAAKAATSLWQPRKKREACLGHPSAKAARFQRAYAKRIQSMTTLLIIVLLLLLLAAADFTLADRPTVAED
jgi:hypothetical protein